MGWFRANFPLARWRAVAIKRANWRAHGRPRVCITSIARLTTGSRLNSPGQFVIRRFNLQYRWCLCGHGHSLHVTVERAKAAFFFLFLSPRLSFSLWLSRRTSRLQREPRRVSLSRRDKAKAHVIVIRKRRRERPNGATSTAIDTDSSRSFSYLFTKTRKFCRNIYIYIHAESSWYSVSSSSYAVQRNRLVNPRYSLELLNI